MQPFLDKLVKAKKSVMMGAQAKAQTKRKLVEFMNAPAKLQEAMLAQFGRQEVSAPATAKNVALALKKK